MLAEKLRILAHPPMLWSNFIATLALTAVFGAVMHFWDVVIIDEMYDAGAILAHIADLTPKQRSVHAWLTGSVDVLYPLVYGGFFIGVALKAFGRTGIWWAIPSALVIPVDLFEGFTQIMLLNGHTEYIHAKVAATPIKLVLFVAGLAITSGGLFQIFRSRDARRPER
uniref:hypothetical protein n=1 Tax=uncultured Erythrobacter sp. TaxID=263913 RepID=UPI002615980E|nr:hypothetical protein [uncultured Erythrobacter sp.]